MCLTRESRHVVAHVQMCQVALITLKEREDEEKNQSCGNCVVQHFYFSQHFTNNLHIFFYTSQCRSMNITTN